MLIKARRQLPPSTDYRANDYELVDVEVPDPFVLCERLDVRVIASFAHFLVGDYDYPDLDTLTPALTVEYSTGEDALGQRVWRTAATYHDGLPPRVVPTIDGLAQMLAAKLYTLKPSDYVIVDAPATESAAS